MRPDDEVEVEPGSLLVAAPSLNDPNFTRTVVYIIDQRPEGTLGVVLNRPSDVAVHDVLPPWGSQVTKPQCIYIGGPVEQKTALCLAALKPGTDPSTVEVRRYNGGRTWGVERGPVSNATGFRGQVQFWLSCAILCKLCISSKYTRSMYVHTSMRCTKWATNLLSAHN